VSSTTRAGAPASTRSASGPLSRTTSPWRPPRAALALCERLGSLLGTQVDTGELESAVDTYSDQVTEAVSSDPETAAYVEQLEQRSDELGEEVDIPSGESLAAELTRFLRERDEEEDTPGEAGPSAQ